MRKFRPFLVAFSVIALLVVGAFIANSHATMANPKGASISTLPQPEEFEPVSCLGGCPTAPGSCTSVGENCICPDGHHGKCQQCPDLTFICVKNGP